MDLISTLWFLIGAGAFVFAIDTGITLVRHRSTTGTRLRWQRTWFGILMLGVAVGCASLGLYEVVN